MGYMSEYNDNQVYDPASDSWTTKAPLPVGSGDHVSAVLDQKIYILAGGGIENTRFQIYDTQSNTWAAGALPVSQRWPGAAATTGVNAAKRVFVIGGSDPDTQTSNLGILQIYNPQTGTWTFGAKMITPRDYIRAAVINDVIFAIGGGSNSQNNEAYFPSKTGEPQTPPIIDASWSSSRGNPANTGVGKSLAPKTNRTAWIQPGAAGASGTTPAVADGKVFVGDEEGTVWALNETDGAILWRRNGSSFTACSPAAAYGMVFVSQGAGNMEALDEDNGTLLWQNSNGTNATVTAVGVADGLAFFSANDKFLYCLNATTGHLLWTHETGLNMTQPAVVDYRVFSGYYSAASKAAGVQCLLEFDGSQLWQAIMPVSDALDSFVPTVSNAMVILALNQTGRGPTLQLIAEYSGNVKGSSQVSYGPSPNSFLSVTGTGTFDTYLYFGDGDGYVYSARSVMNINPAWKHYVGIAKHFGCPSPTSVADGKVYTASDKAVFALDVNGGNEVWSYTVADANPPVASDGYIIFSSPNATYAIQDDPVAGQPTPSPSSTATPTPVIPEFQSIPLLLLAAITVGTGAVLFRRKRQAGLVKEMIQKPL